MTKKDYELISKVYLIMSITIWSVALFTSPEYVAENSGIMIKIALMAWYVWRLPRWHSFIMAISSISLLYGISTIFEGNIFWGLVDVVGMLSVCIFAYNNNKRN